MVKYDDIVILGQNHRAIGRDNFLLNFLAQFLGGMDEVEYDFGSAHYLFNAFQHVPDEPYDYLTQIIKKFGRREPLSQSDKQQISSFEEVVRKMLSDETTLDLSEHTFYGIDGSTRDALDITLSSLVGVSARKKIALPIPNWHFHEMSENAKKLYKFTYFEALDEESLVNGFKKVAEKENVKILLLAMPAVPLMYNVSESAGKEMNDIALKHGIDIVIDDVLRGVQPMGQRNSIARYFTRPYIVEGFSKRFGDENFAHLSYVLTPHKGVKIRKFCESEEYSLISGLGTKLALSYASIPALEELQMRNQAFDDGLLYDTAEGTLIRRPSTTHLTSLVEVPANFKIKMQVFQQICFSNDIDISIPSEYYPAQFSPSPSLERLFRITVGRMDVEKIYRGANILGNRIKRYSQ